MNAIVSQEQLAIEQVKRLVNIVVALKNEVFVNGVDFGTIPGTGDKPTLLQPGMEKLLKALHLRAEYVERSKIEDFDKPLIYYRYECRLIDWETGICVGTSIGSANSHEKKWRWREQKRLCPVCGKPAIIKGSDEYGGGWVCWKKAKPDNGCGARFRDGDPAIESQVAGQIENPDIMDQMNTIDKIAQKRSLGSAIKTVANVSMLYTVDLEDFTPYDTGSVVQGVYTVVTPSEETRASAPLQPAPAPQPVQPVSTPVIDPKAVAPPVAPTEPIPPKDDFDEAFGQEQPAGTTMLQIGKLNMTALLNSALKEKLVKHRAHFINLLAVLKRTEAIDDKMSADQVMEVIRNHEHAKEQV